MKLPIYLIGHPVLRKKAVEIDKDYPNLKELIDNMFETMYDANGVGLAAPQVGVSIRLYVIDANPMSNDFPELKDFKRIFINPKIIEHSKETEAYEEGCLSIPGINEFVNRYAQVTMEYYDENWNFKTEKLVGFQAIVVQHEYDHLEGVLFTDKIALLRKRLIKAKLNAIAKGKVSCFYKTVV
ncbi:MAG TPA: peptide deformylase [Bacteroidales bacterium]|jgi:peptide deformylase|nr:peptide deformylase [Bacteroidales bacterium]MDD4234600.1 peptide deformylase [Bacteroidales bacterium]MDY0161325.1 peptide deformylase [Bacteroidales bacterium]HXK80686.1 peptide deformylase [Bacteroidales bacterium]